jgi:iron complex transport system substrate-binding protein
LALGLKPVGSVNGRGQTALPAYLGSRVQGIASVGSLAEPSLEQIVALQPDLILVGGIFPQLEALLPQLREIAPVVVTYGLEADWKTAFLGTANALNQTAAAEAFLADYDSRAQSLIASLGIVDGTEASITRWMPDGPVVMALDSFSSRIVSDLGFVRPAHQQIEGYSHSEPISLEQLDLVDGEWLFIGTLNPDADAALAAAQENPLFQQLSAVQTGHVAVVDGTIWTSRGGPLAAHLVLDDIEAALQSAD